MGSGRFGLDCIIAVAMPENVGSWRVMEKAGMRYVGLADYYGLEGLKKYGAEPGWWKPPQTGRDTSFVRLREHSTAAHQTPAVRGIRVSRSR